MTTELRQLLDQQDVNLKNLETAIQLARSSYEDWLASCDVERIIRMARRFPRIVAA